MIQQFDVTLTRTATRRLKISVPAETLGEARKTALDIAGDCDFGTGSECEPEYGVEGLSDQETCDECGATTPEGATTVEGMWHDPSCSLHMEPMSLKCPKCGKSHVDYDPQLPVNGRCRDCTFTGRIREFDPELTPTAANLPTIEDLDAIKEVETGDNTHA